MEIVLARDMGFCFGVRRAVEMMEEDRLTDRSMLFQSSLAFTF